MLLRLLHLLRSEAGEASEAKRSSGQLRCTYDYKNHHFLMIFYKYALKRQPNLLSLQKK